MTFNLSTLSVASLDFATIKQNLIAFLSQYPEFRDYDLSNPSSASGVFLDILAANTAYNGFYLQQTLTNSFVSSATNRKALLLLASNAGILVQDSISSRVLATVTNTTTTDIPAYYVFNGISSSGVQITLYNTEIIPASTSNEIELVSGFGITEFGNFDLASQSLVIPYIYDPSTIQVTVDDEIWTYVDVTTNVPNGNVYTIINGIEGYIVSTNIQNATQITSANTVVITAVKSTGNLVSNVTINASPAGTEVEAVGTTTIGHNSLSIDYLKTFVVSTTNCRNRAVTQQDYKDCVALYLTEQGQETDAADVTVTTPNIGTVRVYVAALTTASLQASLIAYLQTVCMAGVLVEYGE